MENIYQSQKMFILGMARSGYEVAKLLLERGNKVLITDKKEQDEKHVLELEKLGAKVVITDKPEDLLDDTFDSLVTNPGINISHTCIKKAKKLEIEVTTEMELVYNILPKDVFIIAITGSNGKTTTTTLIHEILKSAGKRVHLGGNIGFPVASIYNKIRENDILLLEVSSHQLQYLDKFKANISVLTNLSETHLDFFNTYENYINHKLKIFNNQTNDDIAIINNGNADSVKLLPKIKSQVMFFSLNDNTDISVSNNSICYYDEPVVKISDIRIRGNHNIENVMCAIAVTKKLGVENVIINEVLKKFGGVEHRCEFVLKLNGREFYNDSKSTNVIATEMALSAFKSPVILILGGLDRGHSFDELETHLNYVKLIVTYGETKDRIKEFADRINKECVVLSNLENAVKVSYNLSEIGDSILLSPACASWDQFSSFEERGDAFKKYVEELK